MNRWLYFGSLVLAGISFAAGSANADQVYGIEGPKGLAEDYFLGAVKGEGRLVKNGDKRNNWIFEETRQGTLIRVQPDKDDKWGGWYLSYDVKGTKKEVFLTRKPGPGSYWSVVKNVTKENLPYTTKISAAAGKLKGWSLTAGAKSEKLKDYKGRPFTARKAVLARDGKKPPRFYIFEMAP
jgi:hypothetical protein